MKIRVVALLILISITGYMSCNNDDDGDIIEFVENDRTEQQVIDNDSILGYLKTHYYNSSDFDATNLDPNISDILITELETTVPDGHMLLIDELNTTINPDGKLELHTTVYEDTDYEFYILKLNQGGGNASPKFADNVVVQYEGFTLDNDVFDSAGIPVEFDLLDLVPGWKKVLTNFNTTESYIENTDGTVEFTNHGTGVMFLPSGLGYFSSSINGYTYAPLVFKFELLYTYENDHDGDGIPSYLEDLNNDGEFTINFDDLTDEFDDDTDGDGFPNYVDSDDDGDGILTIYEDLEDIDLTVDSDGDGDPTNDKDGDGDPTNDDTDGDGIPNYLDADSTESNQ